VAEARICQFIREHQQPEKSKELAQYVSLAMNISGPPFELKGKEADLPPDASNVAGFVPGLQTFFEAAHLARVWNKYQPAYEQRLDALHEPLAKMLLATDLYLRLPQSSYLGREFVIYVDPQLPPGQVNARNYASDYFVAVSPARVGSHMDEIRHTYLHFVLDPLLLKRANQVKKLEPILQSISDAPMDQSYKQDASLLVTESLIRAVEARLLPATGDAKQTEGARSGRAEDSMKQGFVLTRYFYDQLAQFEKDTTGIRDAFPDMLYSMDVDRERKRAEQTQFASAASSEVLGSGATAQPKLLDIAEAKLAANDVQAARRIAQQVIDEKTPGEDPSRALFVLARTAALSRDVDAAQAMFERTLEIAKEPRIVAWSHISLGRIFDLKCERDQAVTHYRAALSAGDATPETQAAAKRGIDTSPPAGRCTGDSN
jgi:tetratricopeptide (TPR) repeat protein